MTAATTVTLNIPKGLVRECLLAFIEMYIDYNDLDPSRLKVKDLLVEGVEGVVLGFVERELKNALEDRCSGWDLLEETTCFNALERFLKPQLAPILKAQKAADKAKQLTDEAAAKAAAEELTARGDVVKVKAGERASALRLLRQHGFLAA